MIRGVRRSESSPATTYAGYEDCVERNLIPAFGRCRLLDLRPKRINDWVTAHAGVIPTVVSHAEPGELSSSRPDLPPVHLLRRQPGFDVSIMEGRDPCGAERVQQGTVGRC
ncbi:hypothetical protein ACIRRH_39010 [Kitasatospora sp. NPDC101235]|uniref:hypothetical protein n=1 Tax=Kitasatospora sp. NPDC101235 TaxID=3364101 RepID=UPI003806E2A4